MQSYRMSMKIVAVNASPRRKWNTATLVQEAADGAASVGAEVIHFDLYDLERYTGCVSCFGCKRDGNKGVCIHRDGLAPVLDAIRDADGLIIGTPNYLGEVSASFRAMYERLIFQYITYNREAFSCNPRRIPVLMIMTSNASEEMYHQMGYDQVLSRYRQTLDSFIGPTEVMVYGDTLQVQDYSPFDWNMFDPEAKIARHENVFPEVRKGAFEVGSRFAEGIGEGNKTSPDFF